MVLGGPCYPWAQYLEDVCSGRDFRSNGKSGRLRKGRSRSESELNVVVPSVSESKNGLEEVRKRGKKRIYLQKTSSPFSHRLAVTSGRKKIEGGQGGSCFGKKTVTTCAQKGYIRRLMLY